MIDILSQIRDLCKKQIVLPFFTNILFMVLLVLLILKGTFFPANPEDIWDVTADDKYVTLTADKLYYSGYNLIKSGQSTYGYYYSLENDKCLFVIVPVMENPPETISNYKFTAKVIDRNNSYEKMINSFAEDLGWTTEGLESITSDFLLSQAHYHPVWDLAALWILLIALLISLKNFIPLVLYIRNPLKYPICNSKSPDDNRRLIKLAEAEIKKEILWQEGSLYITEHYFVDLSTSRILVIPLRRIVWCYRIGVMAFKHSKRIPEYTLFFTLRDGTVLQCRHKSIDDTATIMKTIDSLGYNIVMGYSEEKRKKVKKKLKNI